MSETHRFDAGGRALGQRGSRAFRAAPAVPRATGTRETRPRPSARQRRAQLPSWVARGAVPAVDALALTAGLILSGVSGVGSVFAVTALVSLAFGEQRHLRWNPRLSSDAPWIVTRMGVALVAVSPWAFLAQSDARALLGAFVLSIPCVFGGRALSYRAQRRLRHHGWMTARTLIVGAGEMAQRLARTLEDHPEYGLRPIGFAEDAPSTGTLPLPVLCRTPELSTALRALRVQRVVVAFGGTREAQMIRILRACDAVSVELLYIPRFFELGGVPDSPECDDVWGIPLVRFRRSVHKPVSRALKRSFDVAVAAVAITLLSPLLLAAVIGVRTSSPGPVLFRQERVGRHGRPFRLWKFRSMRVNSDSDTQWTVTEDDRITRFGRFMRRTSLDELPQLFNVLSGEMSLVGPRPERPFFVDRFAAEIPGYSDRHRVPPGVTGWAQVHGLRGDTSIEERARFDNFYVENWSLWLDVVILFQTLRVLRTGQ